MTDRGDGEGADERIGELYALPPEEFTAARDELARALRAEGDRAGGAAVKKLRRPAVVAWALNQLVRRHPAEVRELLDVNSELQQAQRKALSGLGPAALREAQRRRRSVVDALTEHAAVLLRERGRDTGVHAVRRALEAASVDERAAAALVEGRLTQPPEVSTGFDTVEGLTLLTESPPTPETAPAQDTPSRRQAEEEAAARRAAAEEAAARLAAAEQAAARAANEAEGRRHEAEEAARAASEADSTLERLTQELTVAREQAGQARTRSREAAAAAREAETLARRLEQERRAAARDLPT